MFFLVAKSAQQSSFGVERWDRAFKPDSLLFPRLGQATQATQATQAAHSVQWRCFRIVNRENTVDSQEILAHARQKLDASSYPAVRRVECRIQGDTVVLTGTVRTFYMKQLAQESVRNSCLVRNEIEVVSGELTEDF